MYDRHLSPSIPELERDSEDILMIQYADNGRDTSNNTASNNTIANSVGVSVNVTNNIMDDENDQPSASNSNVPSTSGISRVTVGPSSNSNVNDNTSSGRFLLQANFPSLFESNNVARHDESASGNGDASNESATPGSPNASNVIGRIHITTNNSRAGGIGSVSTQPNSLSQLIQFRTQRNSNRQRRCAYLNLNSRNTNPPAILQRLLGPTVAQNVNIGLGQVIANANGSASFRDATRVVVMDNGFGILSNAGEPAIDLLDQAGYLFGRSLAATLNNTPSALHWWLEEAKVLGIESQADVCLTVCNDLIPELEAQRTLELSKTRSKRKKKSPSDSSSKQNQCQLQKQKSGTNQSANEHVSNSRTDGTAQATNSNEVLSIDSEQTITNIENLSVQATDNENVQDQAEREELMRSYDSDETDDSEQGDDYDDDNSSKNEDDLEIEEANTENQNLAQNINTVNDEDEENAEDVDDDDRTGKFLL